MELQHTSSAGTIRKAILLLACGVMVVSGLKAQDARVSLSNKSITIFQAVSEIEAQTGYTIGFKSSNFNGARKVNLPRTQGTTKEILGLLLAGSGQTWETNGDYIIVTPAPQPRPVVAKVEPVYEPQPEAVRAFQLAPVTYTEEIRVEPAPVPAPRGNYLRTDRLQETPHWAVKTNLLWDATASIWLAPEIRVGAKTTLDLPVMINWWDFKDNTKWKHTLFQPGIRFWSCEAFNGFFWGIHAHGGIYNVGHLPNPPFSDYMNQHRFQGWLVGAGASVGYQWILGKRLGIEAEVGAGYAYLDYKTYRCQNCGQQVGKETKHYFGPTKAAVSLVFLIK